MEVGRAGVGVGDCSVVAVICLSSRDFRRFRAVKVAVRLWVKVGIMIGRRRLSSRETQGSVDLL